MTLLFIKISGLDWLLSMNHSSLTSLILAVETNLLSITSSMLSTFLNPENPYMLSSDSKLPLIYKSTLQSSSIIPLPSSFRILISPLNSWKQGGILQLTLQSRIFSVSQWSFQLFWLLNTYIEMPVNICWAWGGLEKIPKKRCFVWIMGLLWDTIFLLKWSKLYLT